MDFFLGVQLHFTINHDYFIEKQTGSEQEAVEELYQIAKYEYESTLRYLERERQRKERMQNGQR